jgi:opacity protein-like surface antigen
MNCNLKGFNKYILIFLMLLFSLSTYAQGVRVDTIKITTTRTLKILTRRTIPKFILQVNAHFNSGALELSGHNGSFSRSDFIRGKSFGARNGFGFDITGKLPLHKKGNFWITATSNYNRFQSNLLTNNTKEGQVAYNIFGGGVGIDYNITPAHRVKYYVGATTLFNVIYANATLINTDISNTSPPKASVKINPAFRIGYALFLGLEYAFDKNVGMNCGIRFSHLNLLLKKSTYSADSSSTDLNDDNAPPPSIYAGWKQFAFTSIYAGISYYFGVKERRYKLP